MSVSYFAAAMLCSNVLYTITVADAVCIKDFSNKKNRELRIFLSALKVEYCVRLLLSATPSATLQEAS